MQAIRLKQGRERSVQRRHPWIYSGAVEEVIGYPGLGETVDVLDQAGTWLARAAYSPNSNIRARIWTWNPEEAVDDQFFERKIKAAILSRISLAEDTDTNAYREIHAESDGIPGVVLDRYNEQRVVQLLTAGAEAWRESIISVLAQLGDCDGIYERSNVDVRKMEGLPPKTGCLWGKEPDAEMIIQQHGMRFYVNVLQGQKTGFYLDQRENRRRVRSLVRGRAVLDCFSYTGGFTVAALAGGATHVEAIDSSTEALMLAKKNVAINELALDQCEWIQGDVFTELRKLRDRDKRFDAVVLDPPRFAPTASQAQKAARGYKDINLLAFKLLRPGGLLFTFSCSGGVGFPLFEKIVAGAALDAGVEVRIIGWFNQPSDHPVGIQFPEGRYLKGLTCLVG
ncbi:MAG: methyltransferase domain-containing protein [Anaerolineales bacterium]|nr:methyltransferase domain-containing protein [Anaerolineales bacterium]